MLAARARLAASWSACSLAWPWVEGGLVILPPRLVDHLQQSGVLCHVVHILLSVGGLLGVPRTQGRGLLSLVHGATGQAGQGNTQGSGKLQGDP